MQFKCTRNLRGWVELVRRKAGKKVPGRIVRNMRDEIVIHDIPGMTEDHVRSAFNENGLPSQGDIIAIDFEKVPAPAPLEGLQFEGIQRTPVKSSNIVSVGYDFALCILEVEFKTGGIYQYKGVPEVLKDSMLGAESIGKFFAMFIRDAFPHTKVN